MSIDAMRLVWDMNVPPADKLILLKLADVANDEGELQYKGKDEGRFCVRCSTSERTLARFRKKYTDLGIIVVVSSGGGRGKERQERLDLDKIRDWKQTVPDCHGFGERVPNLSLNPANPVVNSANSGRVSETPNTPLKELTILTREPVKEIVPEILDDIDLLLLDFKNLTGVTFSKKGHLKFIAPRLKEGRSIADLRLILLHKVQEWHGTEFEKYLTPESLYRPSKIDTKLSMAVAWDEKGRPYQGKNGATEDQKKERLFQDLGFTQDEIHPV